MKAPAVYVQAQQKLKNAVQTASRYLDVNQRYLHHAKGARILAYHGICRGNPFLFNTLFIRQQIFEKQLLLYKKYFHIISLDDFFHQRFSNDKFNCCLTFDDGFANNYDYVLPLLEKYEVPATFFITGIRKAGYDILWNDCLALAKKYGPEKLELHDKSFIKNRTGNYRSSIDGKCLADLLRIADFKTKAQIINQLQHVKTKAPTEYWQQMKEDQIKKLSVSKWVTIGSHSFYHNDLANVPTPLLQDDLRQSKLYLEHITGKPITALAFPYGSYSPLVIKEAKAAGYTQLLATDFITPSDKAELSMCERLTINPFCSPINQVYATIRGSYY